MHNTWVIKKLFDVVNEEWVSELVVEYNYQYVALFLYVMKKKI